MPQNFGLSGTATAGGKLPSNSIIDIVPQGDSIWFGTGQGLAQLHKGGGWSVISESDGIGRGGVSALYVSDTIIWVATAYSEKIDQTYYPAGGGIAYSRDNGTTWHWVAQPVDDRNETRYKPTTTNIQNVTYDIAVSDSAVWITSWGGGLRRKLHTSTVWEVVTPDGQPFSVLDNLNHRAFSVAFKSGTLWVGTAAGVSRSDNEGKTWVKYSHLVQDPNTISGNFVTASAVQPLSGGTYKFWVASWKAQTVSEFYGASVFDGTSWSVSLSDSTVLPNGNYLVDEYGSLRVHNFGFQGKRVWAAADGALWWHPNEGIVSGTGADTWKVITPDQIYDPTISEGLNNADFFSVAGVGDSIWIGTDDGLVVGWSDPLSGEMIWRIQRSFSAPGKDGEAESYAYPSPFSPRRGHQTRFQFPAQGATMSIGLTIVNFGMEIVYEKSNISLAGGGAGAMAGYAAISWDGLDRYGKVVANGVYFYKVTVGGETYWGKVMVVD